MWIASLDGFFSIVEDVSDTARVVVRARVRRDLVALRRAYVPTLGRIYEGSGTDYPYRCVVSKADFAAGLAKAVTEGLRYANYKTAIHQRDPLRAQVLARAWSVFRELEQLEPPRRQRFGPSR